MMQGCCGGVRLRCSKVSTWWYKGKTSKVGDRIKGSDHSTYLQIQSIIDVWVVACMQSVHAGARLASTYTNCLIKLTKRLAWL